MRHLHNIQEAVAWLRARGCRDLVVNSRQVRAGDGFVAWPGAATDGRRYVSQALAGGAVACLVEHDGLDALSADAGMAGWVERDDVASLDGLKAACAPLAAEFYGHPSRHMDVVAFTGTNGKTSSAWWLAQLLQAAGRASAVVGTLGMGRPGGAWADTGLTTPDPFMFHGALRRFADEGVRACAIEASSIGVAEGRLDATRVAVAAFTNFTQDHLDYHGTMDAYWAAKRALFQWDGLRAAVVNIDDNKGLALAHELASRPDLDVWTVSIDNRAARLHLAAHAVTPQGMSFTLQERGAPLAASMELPLVGRYSLSNLLGVVAVARALGVPQADVLAACTSLTPVPGRMETVPAGADAPLVLVDYAHTPDALQKALLALQPVAAQRQGRLWCVVGCGGDRDASKRPIMAAEAEQHANVVVLTSDNPRSEDPNIILGHMVAGLREPEQAHVEPDRALAIAHAVTRAEPHDVVLIAGKGHEAYQDIQGVRRPFSDVQQAAAALASRVVAGGVA